MSAHLKLTKAEVDEMKRSHAKMERDLVAFYGWTVIPSTPPRRKARKLKPFNLRPEDVARRQETVRRNAVQNRHIRRWLANKTATAAG